MVGLFLGLSIAGTAAGIPIGANRNQRGALSLIGVGNQLRSGMDDHRIRTGSNTSMAVKLADIPPNGTHDGSPMTMVSKVRSNDFPVPLQFWPR